MGLPKGIYRDKDMEVWASNDKGEASEDPSTMSIEYILEDLCIREDDASFVDKWGPFKYQCPLEFAE